jgi:uncharacterized coiled-coil protein SlyX
MNLKEYMESDDPNLYWRLKSGEALNLLDEAIEQIADLQRQLTDKQHAVGGLDEMLCECKGELAEAQEKVKRLEDVLKEFCDNDIDENAKWVEVAFLNGDDPQFHYDFEITCCGHGGKPIL